MLNIQRLQTILILLLILGCGAVGSLLWTQTNAATEAQRQHSAFQDDVLRMARERNLKSLAADPDRARTMLQSCGLINTLSDLPTAEDLESVQAYLALNDKIAALFKDGHVLMDACVDDSLTPRILFFTAKPETGRGEFSLGQLDEAYPNLGTVATMTDKQLFDVVAASEGCAVTGNGAAPEREFLVTCAENANVSRGYVMDYVKRVATQLYRCDLSPDGTCAITNVPNFARNKGLLPDAVVENAR